MSKSNGMLEVLPPELGNTGTEPAETGRRLEFSASRPACGLNANSYACNAAAPLYPRLGSV